MANMLAYFFLLASLTGIGAARINGGENGQQIMDFCVFQCFRTKPDIELELFFGNLGHPMQIKYIHKLLVPRVLTKYCNHVNNTWNCMENCQDSDLKSTFKRAFSPLSYMCLETDFVKYSGCYKSVYDQMEDACCKNDAKCGLQRKRVEAKFGWGNVQNGTESRQAYTENLIATVCEYADCANRCRRPTILTKCGPQANSVLNTWYRKMVEALDESRVFVGFNINTPKACDPVGQQT